MIDVLGEVFRSLGRPADAASVSGSAQARLKALMAMTSGTTVAPVMRPDLANSVNVGTGAGAWGYGSWVQICAASSLAAHMCAFVAIFAVGQDDEYQIAIGHGGAGSEVVAGEYSFRTVTSAIVQNGPVFTLPIPLQIPANARVAVKCASKLGAASLNLKLGFYPRIAV